MPIQLLDRRQGSTGCVHTVVVGGNGLLLHGGVQLSDRILVVLRHVAL
jgi:hypothetical protein